MREPWSAWLCHNKNRSCGRNSPARPLFPTRNTKAAERFLSKTLTGLKVWDKPRVINTDKVPTYAAALAKLKKEASVRRTRSIGR
jgi:transposase-like protein